MLKKMIVSAIRYILFGGAVLIKIKAIEQDIYNLNNIKPWEL